MENSPSSPSNEQNTPPEIDQAHVSPQQLQENPITPTESELEIENIFIQTILDNEQIPELIPTPQGQDLPANGEQLQVPQEPQNDPEEDANPPQNQFIRNLIQFQWLMPFTLRAGRIFTRITGAYRYNQIEPNPMTMMRLQKWKMRTFYLSLAVIGICTFNLLCCIFQLIGMQVHTEFFSADKFVDLLLLDERFLPMYYLQATFLIITLSLASLNYIARPKHGPFFYHFLHFSQFLFFFGIGVFIYQLVSYQMEYPDDEYEGELKLRMEESMNRILDARNEDGDLEITKSWDDTQFIFKCCGTESYKDWLMDAPEGRNPFIPSSCCRMNRVISNCTIAFSFKKGCLEAQMNAFKSNEFRLHFGFLIQYIPFIILWVSLAEIYAHSGQRPMH